MKPKLVVNISINTESPQEHLSKLERDVARLHAQDYRAAGIEPPPEVRARAGESQACSNS